MESSFIFRSLLPFRFILLGQVLIVLLWSVDLSLRPYLLKRIINMLPSIPPHQAFSELTRPVFFYLGTSFFISLSYRYYDYLWLNFNPPLKRHIGNLFIQRLMQHSQTFFQDHFSGSLGNKMKEVISGIPDLCKLFIESFLHRFLTILIAFFSVWSIHWRFALILALWASIFIGVSFFLSRRAGKYFSQAAEIRSKMLGKLIDILTNMMNVRIFARDHLEVKHFSYALNEWMKADQARDWCLLKLFAFQGLSFTFYQTFSLFFLILGFQEGTVTAGDFAFIIAINISLVDCLWMLSKNFSLFSETFENVSQGLRIILSPLQIQDVPQAKLLQIQKGEIVFDRVDFQYRQVTPLFHQLSVRIHAGEKVGLVGYSGSGKSTFIHLILRLYDLQAGQIFIDGQDIQQVTQNSLREAIGMIPQDPSLFHRSLMENILYGKPEADPREVLEAAQKARAHEFISQLPQGYESLVGERGVKLSGGQRQRIAIARAFLKNAPILILDEATSQLDSVTEKEIQASLWVLMQGKTTLIIAHRLSTLLEMDRILVFDQGKIVESGHHRDLIQARGQYFKLWQTQVGGFLPH